MARKITVSAIGTLLEFDAAVGEDYGSLADKSIEFYGRELARVLPDKPDLIAFHETFDIPFFAIKQGDAQNYVRSALDKTLGYFIDTAKKNRCYIAYPCMRFDETGLLRNTIFIIDRGGEICGYYDKNHCIHSEIENYGVKTSDREGIVDLDFGRVGLLNCFDLNFEKFMAKYQRKGIDLLLFCSHYHGSFMQEYWAYSCRAHMLSAIKRGPCRVLAPTGEVLGQSSNYYCNVTRTINLDTRVAHINYNEAKFRAAKEKYGSGFLVSDTPYLAAVTISSEMDGISIDDLKSEFKFELLDEYFDRYLKYRENELSLQ